MVNNIQNPNLAPQVPVGAAAPTSLSGGEGSYIQDPAANARAALAQFKTPQEKTKIDWMHQAHQLNPTVDVNTLSSIYDNKVMGGQTTHVSIQDQLKALEHLHHVKAAQTEPVSPELDPDKAPNGIDASDKLSIIGSLVSGGHMGLEEAKARAQQLMAPVSGLFESDADALAKAKIVAKGGKVKIPTYADLEQKVEEKKQRIADVMNRTEARNKVYQEALLMHPVAAALGKFGGSTLPLMAMPTAGIEGMVEDAATKFGAKHIAESFPKWMGRGAAGASVANLTYDPQSSSGAQRETLGALMNMALPYGGKLIRRLKSPVSEAVQKISQQYGVHLPPFPVIEKAAAYIPFSGMGGVMKTRGEEIAQAGRGLARGVIGQAPKDATYGASLHGDILKAYNENSKKAAGLFNKTSALADKAGGSVGFSNFRTQAAQILDSESKLPVVQQNKPLIKAVTEYSALNDTSYNQANRIKQRLGQTLGKIEKGYGFGTYSGEEKHAYEQLYRTINMDMDEYADDIGGDLKETHDAANQLYVDKVLPFRRGNYSKIVDPQFDTDALIGKFLKPDRSIMASKLMEVLPEGATKGQTAARAAILHTALDKADIPGGSFNAEKFITEALRLKSANNIVFTKEQNEALKGYQRLVNYTKQLSPGALDPAKRAPGLGKLASHGTGMFLAYEHPHVILPLLLSANVASRVLTSQAARKLLMKVSALAGKATESKMPPLLNKILTIGASSVGARANLGGL